jgi:DNA-binding transcriptional LysR family regulator
MHWDRQSKARIGSGGEITFPHTHLCIEAALSGLGVALVERRLVRKELNEGHLIAPWGFIEPPAGLMALPAAGRLLPAELATFIAWLRARLENDPT